MKQTQRPRAHTPTTERLAANLCGATDYRIAPIEKSGKQCESYSGRVIHATRLDATLSLTASWLRRTQFSGWIALDERKNMKSSLKTSEVTPTIARANCIMCSSCQSQPAPAAA